MFKDNEVLLNLKAQIRKNLPLIEGKVKATEKEYGFLYTDKNKSYYIAPIYMKKLLHGDKVKGLLHEENNNKHSFEPVELLEPLQTEFIMQVSHRNGYVILKSEQFKNRIFKTSLLVKENPQYIEDLYVLAQLVERPMQNDTRYFLTDIVQIIGTQEDNYLEWNKLLALNHIDANAYCDVSKLDDPYTFEDDGIERIDLTHLPFITIDGQTTKDRDDALYFTQNEAGLFELFIAIADPSSYVLENDNIDVIAKKRGYSLYLPEMNIPLLPKTLSDNLCSLVEHQRRSVMVLKLILNESYEIQNTPEFFMGYIQVSQNLSYDNVNQLLMNDVSDETLNAESVALLKLLYPLVSYLYQKRQEKMLVSREHTDFHLVVREGKLIEIKKKKRNQAQKLIEEMMIFANEMCSQFFYEHGVKAIYVCHDGFDKNKLKQVIKLLKKYNYNYTKEMLQDKSQYIQLMQELNKNEEAYLLMKLSRMQKGVYFSVKPLAHFALGLDYYCTWTSPIRKYADLLNHRLLKSIIRKQVQQERVDVDIIDNLIKTRRNYRQIERELSNLLYFEYMQKQDNSLSYEAVIIDINRSNMRIKLDNGAIAFVYYDSIMKKNVEISTELSTVHFKDINKRFKISDAITVTVSDFNYQEYKIIAIVI